MQTIAPTPAAVRPKCPAMPWIDAHLCGGNGAHAGCFQAKAATAKVDRQVEADIQRAMDRGTQF